MTSKNTANKVKAGRGADLSMMTHVPIQSAWFTRLPAFQSSDPRIVRGCINMLMSAFHSVPCGSLPNTLEGIASAAHLSTEEARENLDVLTKGWKSNEEVIVFQPLYDMGQRMKTDYGDALTQLQDSAALAIAAPDLFNSELLPEQGAALQAKVSGSTQAKAKTAISLGATRLQRLLPADACMTNDIRGIMLERGFGIESHDEIWESFKDWHTSRAIKSANWTSEFRHWLKNKVHYGRFNPGASAEELNAPLARSDHGGPASTRNTGAVRFSFSTRPGANGGAHRAVMTPSQQRGIDSKQNALKNLERVKSRMTTAAGTHKPMAQQDARAFKPSTVLAEDVPAKQMGAHCDPVF